MVAYVCVCHACEEQWCSKGWRCPLLWRSRDLDLQRGCTIRLRKAARMWTKQFGDPESELYRRDGLEGLEFKVLEVHREFHYTQVKVDCNQTQLPVWVNVWHRFNEHGRASGVRWADVAPMTR